VFLSIRDWVFADRLSSNSVRERIKRIEQHLSLQHFEKAQHELNHLNLKKQKTKQLALYEIQVLRGIGELKEAFECVKQALERYPEELLFHLEKGKLLLALNRAKDAVDSFSLCVPILRGETDLLALGSALHQAGFSDHCLNLLHPWIVSTQNGELVALAGDALCAQKRFQDAIEMYTFALKLGTKNHHLYVQIGHAYRRLGNLAEAEKIFRKLLDKDSSDLESTLELGACLEERGHFQKALLIYQSGKAWNTKHPQLMQKAGVNALKTKKYSFAQNYFAQVLQEQQEDPQIQVFYGFSLEGQEKWQEAEQTYLRLIQKFPSYPHGYRALAWMFGVGLSKTLNDEQGLNFAYRALKLKNDPTSWEILSACCARQGDFDKAYRIQLSLAKNDKDPKTRARRQQMLRHLRKKIPLNNQLLGRALVA